MIIDYTKLSDEALTGLIEAFIYREGTEYGHEEISLDEKISQIKLQLKSKQVVVVYDEASESANLIMLEDAKKLLKVD